MKESPIETVMRTYAIIASDDPKLKLVCSIQIRDLVRPLMLLFARVGPRFTIRVQNPTIHTHDLSRSRSCQELSSLCGRWLSR